MKRILLITTHKMLLLGMAFCILISATVVLIASIHITRHSQVFRNIETDDILELEKENSRLESLLSSLMPGDQKTLFEDARRNIYIKAEITPAPPLPTSPLSNVIAQGVETKFRTLSNDPQYLRPLYDPDWKGAYYRGWLYLPHKNIEARHRIFAFSLGASMNYDIFGSLGFRPNVSIDAHRNISFLIYGFHVNSVKVFQNQVALVGEPRETGAQIVSIVQNDLLSEGVDTKDFLFQLSTPKGYEVDFLNYNIIRYEYLMKQIEEHTVHPSFADETETKSLEALLRENAALKQELTYFIPHKDEVISQQSCAAMSGNQAEFVDIPSAIKQGKEISFIYHYKNPQYLRALYDPIWKTNYKRKWYYIPKQIEYSLHRLLIIPQSLEKQYDFFGTLGFHEKYQSVKSDQYGFLVYNFDVSKAVTYKNQLIFIGIPSRTGAQIISVNRRNMQGNNNLVRLVTPDKLQIDCTVLIP